ncbi:thioredoxin-like protein CXXS1 [Dioscorea cayenensis subsp. rotundata]|uniref:Thioredoxin-like protein CXXS1 n=1 Tax=Dioscorea cayennensis subsp. rotundata TaxID=55577 RepID=A0AB40D440_DIOCR|nr:thioredoxin-like protein CXXS1 [Dioscorea cayenensis subsp. rotundata]
MEAEEEGGVSSKVLKVDSEEAWDSFITQANTQGIPVFVHFTAAWCVPSIAMNAFFEELAIKYQNIIMFLLVDVDDVKRVAKKMEVKAMPTFVLIKDGKVVDRMVGANPEEINKRIACLSSTP